MNPAPHLDVPLAILTLLFFLVLGFRISMLQPSRERTIAIYVFILYTFGLSGLVVAVQRDAWPFTTYILAAFEPDPERTACRIEFRATGTDGREWLLDPYTFSPQDVQMMELWFEYHYPDLTEAQQSTALDFLLKKANQARARLAAGKGIGPDAWLGRTLSADLWSIMERRLDVPERPYRSLRIYRVCWIPADVFHGRSQGESRILVEHP